VEIFQNVKISAAEFVPNTSYGMVTIETATNSAADIFTFWKISTENLRRILWHQLLRELRKA